ncbi:MAG: hypothetical protein SO468_03835 [Prevotella sp.]|nr:hypothetical protein [Prevotellaceae bacterium]MDY4555300.1 hypothetical protein [Prevotella sp.]
MKEIGQSHLSTINSILFGELRPWLAENNGKSDMYWKAMLRDTATVALSFMPTVKINIDDSVLFNAKLRYYKLRIDNAVNEYLNELFLQTDIYSHSYLKLNKLKITRENTSGLIHDSLEEVRKSGIVGKQLLDEDADYNEDTLAKEICLIFNYVIVALARCFFEVQNRFAKEISEEDKYTIPSFCSTFLGRRSLSDVFSIEAIPPKKPSKDKDDKDTSKDNTPVFHTLKYLHDGADRVRRIDAFTKALTTLRWIDSETNVDMFQLFFKGEPHQCNITWKGSSAVLQQMLTLLCGKKYIELPKGASVTSIMKTQFGKNKDSHSGRIDEAKSKIIEMCIKLLDPNVPLDRGAILRDNDPFIDYEEEPEYDERLLRREGMRLGKHT